MTRRAALISLASVPVALGSRVPSRDIPRTQIDHESHCLSSESAAGYKLLLNSLECGPLTLPLLIAPGVRELSAERCQKMFNYVRGGGWLLLESGVCFSTPEEAERQATTLRGVFGLRLRTHFLICKSQSETGQYIKYSWPIQRLVRAFHAVTPIDCDDRDVIGSISSHPVSAKIAVGRGGVLYLGAMLGPGLFANEREAHEVGRALVGSIA